MSEVPQPRRRRRDVNPAKAMSKDVEGSGTDVNGRSNPENCCPERSKNADAPVSITGS